MRPQGSVPQRRLTTRGFIVIDLDALGDECCEPLGLGFGQVEMIPHAVLAAEESDREPVIAGSEGDIALNKGALGMGSGELCHNDYTKRPIALFQVT
jgi:hypothetical protein